MSESFETVVKIIAVTAALIILAVFLQRTMFAGDKMIDERVCRESIKTHSLLIRSGVDQAPAIECSPRTTTIKPGDDVNRAVAEEMLFCWERWQQGKADLFVNEGTYCNVCSIVSVDEPRELDTQKLFSLEKNGVSYYTLLSPQASLEYPENGLPSQTMTLDANKAAVLFYYDKNHSTQEVLEAMKRDPLIARQVMDQFGVGAAAGFAVGVIAAGACTYASWSLCAPFSGTIVGSFTVLAMSVTGGAANTWWQGVPFPEYIASVYVGPNTLEFYESLGCEYTHQQGAVERVGTAENI